MKNKETILLYPNQIPPGNLYDSGYDFETVAANSYNYSNDITLSNLKTYYGVTTPRMEYIKSKYIVLKISNGNKKNIFIYFFYFFLFFFTPPQKYFFF